MFCQKTCNGNITKVNQISMYVLHNVREKNIKNLNNENGNSLERILLLFT